MRLAEVGAAGQERLAAARVCVEGTGLAARVEAMYLAGAGVGVVAEDEGVLAAGRGVNPEVGGFVDGGLGVRSPTVAFTSPSPSPTTSTTTSTFTTTNDVFDGALRALLAIRKVLEA